MLPVSLQVLEAGDGGGGMSNLSAFSLFDELLLDRFDNPLGPGTLASLLLSELKVPLVCTLMILNVQVSLSVHAAFCN
jgi:hypothetical protein